MENEREEKRWKNLARQIPRNFIRLTKEVIKARPRSLNDLLNLRNRLFAEIWGSNLSAEDRQKLLFAFGPWDDLKMAVLDARCSALPDDKMPQSRAELLSLCEKLLDRTDDFHMRIHFIAGWNGVSREGEAAALNGFCDELWGTRANDPEFFHAVVTGRHGTAVLYLANKRIPLGMAAEAAIRLIYRMALIWCAHDVQATAVRARRSIKGPYSWLHGDVEGERMTAGTVFAVWRPVYNMFIENDGRYRANEEARAGKPEGRPTRHDDVKTIRDRAEPMLDREMLRHHSRHSRDGLNNDVREYAEDQDDLFWNEIRKEKTSHNIVQLQQSQIWYRGLTPLQMVSLSVIRLIQMEAILENQIAGMYRHPIDGVAIFPPMLSFNEADLPHGWRTRALQLVDDLRRTILKDVDHGSRREEVRVGYGERPHDDTYLDGALDFLNDALRQPLRNDPSAKPTGLRATLSLLDVCAMIRLSR